MINGARLGGRLAVASRSAQDAAAAAAIRLGGFTARHPRTRRFIIGAYRALAPETAVIRRGPAKGLSIRTRSANPGYMLGTTEPLVQRALADALRSGDVCYDVGANVGFFTLVAAQAVGPRGRVLAFEPVPTNAIELRRNLALNSMAWVEVFEAAISERDGIGALTGGTSTLDSRLSLNEEGSASDGSGGSEVATRTVDSLVAEGCLPPSVVKIDVEGAEGLVIRGMSSTLSRYRSIVICEMHMVGPIRLAVQALAEQIADATGNDYSLSSGPRGPAAVVNGLDYSVEALDSAPTGTDFWAPHLIARPRERSA